MVKHEQSQRRSPWWQVLQGIAIFFILFVLAFSIDVFSLSIYPLSSSSFKLNEPFTLFHLGEERPVNPTALSEYDEVYASTLRDIGAFSNLITIDLKQENLLIEFALTTPAEEMSEVLTQGLGGKEEHLLRVAFGQIEINGSALSENGLETATWTVDEKEGLITLYIRYFDEHYREGFTLRKTRLSGTQIAPQEEKVILHFDEFKLTEMVPLPYIATKTDAELIVDERNKNDFSVRLEALNPKRPVLGTVPPTQRTTEPTRQDIFQNISELISDIPLFSRVFYAFSELFPLVLFWLLIYRLDLSEDTHLYKVLDITKKILALHFMLYILGSMSSLYYDYEFSKDWIGTFEATLQKIFFTVPNPIFGNGMWRIGIVAFGLLFPTYLNMRENNKPSKISRFLNLRV